MLASKENLAFDVIIITITFFILTGFIVLIIYNHYKTKSGKEKEIRWIIFQTQEKERSRIAKDLHDDIGALLSSVKIQNELIINATAEDHVKKFANKNATLIDRVVKDIRIIVRNQTSKYISDNGFDNELQELAKQYAEANKIKIALDLNYGDFIFENDFAVNLFRIFQELFHNSIKHAACSEITVRTTFSNGMFRAYYSDNGKGFIKSVIGSAGMGTKNIDTRIELFNGICEFKTLPGIETSYSILFPANNVSKNLNKA